jgi:hypothetical protein
LPTANEEDSKILTDVGITDPQFQNRLNGIIGTTNWIEAICFALLVGRFFLPLLPACAVPLQHG